MARVVKAARNTETEWKTADWIRTNLQVGPYALMRLVAEAKVRTRDDLTVQLSGDRRALLYAVDDVRENYVRTYLGRQPAVLPDWQLERRAQWEKERERQRSGTS